MFVVIDTNILVSSLLSRGGAPAQVMALVLRGDLTPCYDFRMMEEYRTVLERPKFNFDSWTVDALLGYFEDAGVSVVPNVCVTEPFVDEDDKAFWEVAKHCNCLLITGNTKHFPPLDESIITAPQFLERFRNGGL